MTVDLWTGRAWGVGSGADILVNIQGVIGSAYDDYVVAGDQSGRYDGGGGTNTLDFSHSFRGLTIDLATGVASNGHANYTLANIQILIGSAYGDRITFGARGEIVTGGLGADVFSLVAGAGASTIMDFSHAQGDRIDLSAYRVLRGFQDVLAVAAQAGADTVIGLPGGGSLTLHNISKIGLTADDFVFARGAPGDFFGTGRGGLFWQNAVNSLTSVWTVDDSGHTSGVSLPAVPGWQTLDVGNFSGGPYGGDFLLRNTTTGMVNIWQDNAGVMSGHDVAQASLDWQIMGTADFNGDGKSDILWRNQANGYVSVWQMDGSTVATTYNPGQVGLEWKLVSAGDFVGDGKAEVLWRNSVTGEVNLWTIDGPGPGQTHGQTIAHLGLEWKAAGSGDFNGDGRADILWWNAVTGQVVIWQMNGAQVLAAQAIGAPGPQWKVVGLADINGDGKSDILWRDSGTGQVVTWQMNGFAVDHFAVLATVDNTWQTINHHYDWA